MGDDRKVTIGDGEQAPSETPSSISPTSVLAACFIGLGIFVAVRFGGGWVGQLESRTGIAESLWFILLVLLVLVFAFVVVILAASISLRLEGIDLSRDAREVSDGAVPFLKESLQSPVTARMARILVDARDDECLASRNRTLFASAENWESLVMVGLLYDRVATMLLESIRWDPGDEIAAKALARAANLIDGVPEHEDSVSLWRGAPDDLDWCDWTTVARTVAENWARSSAQFMEAAEAMRAGDGEDSAHGSDESGGRNFGGKKRWCIACGAEVPEGPFQCPTCAGSRFLWE